MITPEAQAVIDQLKGENDELKKKIAELETQIAAAKQAAADAGESEIFGGIFN